MTSALCLKVLYSMCYKHKAYENKPDVSNMIHKKTQICKMFFRLVLKYLSEGLISTPVSKNYNYLMVQALQG